MVYYICTKYNEFGWVIIRERNQIMECSL